MGNKVLKKLLEEMAQSIINLDDGKASELCELAVREGLDLHVVVESGFGEGIRKAGEMWENGIFFLPELMKSAEIMKFVTRTLLPYIEKQVSGKNSLGRIVIGTVQGDIHDIGKTLVSTFLSASGFEVIDLGVDVKLENFVLEAETHNAQLVCMSSLLTTTMVQQKTVIRMLEEKGLRGNLQVMVGGAPVTGKWASEIGADGYASNAVAAVSKAKSLVLCRRLGKR